MEALLGLFPFGDVADDGEEEGLFVEIHAVEADFGVEFGAVEAAVAPFEALGFAKDGAADFFAGGEKGVLAVGLTVGWRSGWGFARRSGRGRSRRV